MISGGLGLVGVAIHHHSSNSMAPLPESIFTTIRKDCTKSQKL